jgi:DNA-binding HxlR family transcriptional regulator
MRAKSFTDMACSIAGALEMVGDRWGFLLMRDLMLGLSRYDEFKASMDIPAQTLASRLRHFESTGLATRRRYQERPPRDEYRLTDKGRDFWVVLTALREWGDRWRMHGVEGPPVEIIDSSTGRKLQLALVEPRSGARVPAARVAVRAGPGADERMLRRLGAGNGPSRPKRR